MRGWAYSEAQLLRFAQQQHQEQQHRKLSENAREAATSGGLPALMAVSV
jgi:hypothetical protein